MLAVLLLEQLGRVGGGAGEHTELDRRLVGVDRDVFERRRRAQQHRVVDLALGEPRRGGCLARDRHTRCGRHRFAARGQHGGGGDAEATDAQHPAPREPADHRLGPGASVDPAGGVEGCFEHPRRVADRGVVIGAHGAQFAPEVVVGEIHGGHPPIG
jgi:hypothetical protein